MMLFGRRGKWQQHILGVELKLFRGRWSGLHRGMDCKSCHGCIITVLSAASQLNLSRNGTTNYRLGRKEELELRLQVSNGRNRRVALQTETLRWGNGSTED